jgi:hypothetical protein
MLKEAAITKISTLLKVDPAKLKAALADEKEADIDIPEDLNVLTKAEMDARDKNKYETGKKAGEEMIVDNLAKKYEVEAPGKDPEKFVENLTKKIKKETDTNPDARLLEKDKELEKAKKLLKEANDKADEFKNKMDLFQSDTKLLGMLPNNRLETMTNDEYLALTKSAIKIETRDGKEVAIRNGEVVTDSKTMNPIAPAKVIETYYAERKWIKEPEKPNGGRGGGNSTPGGMTGKISKLSELHKQLEEEKISLNGDEAQRRVMAAIKENPDIDMNS